MSNFAAQMQKIIHYIPILTTLFSAYFFVILFKHWRSKPYAYHVMWWMIGVLFYGLGTITESINTLFGYSDANFRAWYIFGALLGGAPLAQGSVYLLMRRKLANAFSIFLLVLIVGCSTLVILSPLHPDPSLGMRMNAKILEWQFIRKLTPIINTYGVIFLAGGAIYSAVKYSRDVAFKSRFYGNVLIAIGAILPGIGGFMTKLGYVEVLYITEFVGLAFIYAGYQIIRKDKFHLQESEVASVE